MSVLTSLRVIGLIISKNFAINMRMTKIFAIFGMRNILNT